MRSISRVPQKGGKDYTRLLTAPIVLNVGVGSAPGNPEATRVKVPLVELDGSRPKETPGKRPRGCNPQARHLLNRHSLHGNDRASSRSRLGWSGEDPLLSI